MLHGTTILCNADGFGPIYDFKIAIILVLYVFANSYCRFRGLVWPGILFCYTYFSKFADTLVLETEANIRGGGKTVHVVFNYMSRSLSLNLYTFKGTQAWNFFFTFFAETETLWSQGPVTRDFWKSYSIRPRYSTFKHFRAKWRFWEKNFFWNLSKKIWFRVNSVTAEMFEHRNSGENRRKRSEIFFENLRRAYKDLI